jgi:hypothetical protein
MSEIKLSGVKIDKNCGSLSSCAKCPSLETVFIENTVFWKRSELPSLQIREQRVGGATAEKLKRGRRQHHRSFTMEAAADEARS